MRQIKFRGKDIETGEWIYGSLVQPIGQNPRVYVQDVKTEGVVSFFVYDVEESTAGQFTGLHDKNGKEIYEGDIVRNKWGGFGVIVWEECSVNVNWGGVDSHSLFYEEDFEHIGNIHDNPEILKNEER